MVADDKIIISHEAVINPGDLEENFIRSSGPGGQNVNKVATAVQLRFDPGHSPSLTEEVCVRLRTLAGNRVTADGVLVARAEERDPDQWWFWTPEWQAGEREAEADLAAGRFDRYESDEEFLEALRSRMNPRDDANP